MQPYAAIYLHLMRATVLRQADSSRGLRVLDVADPAHPVLSHRSAEVALERANESTTGTAGTFIGSQRGRLAGRAARQRAARRGGDHRLRRLGQRSAGGARQAMARVRRRADCWSGSIRVRRTRIPAAGRFDGGGPALLRSVPAGTLADRAASCVAWLVGIAAMSWSAVSGRDRTGRRARRKPRCDRGSVGPGRTLRLLVMDTCSDESTSIAGTRRTAGSGRSPRCRW